MRQGLFEIFGTGKLGLKVDDLNQYSDLVASVGMSIPEGIVIATGIFDQLTVEVKFEEPSEEIEKHECPDFLLSINEEVLDRLEVGKPYAIRSSALSERGGTGIYKSTFFLPTGNKTEDLKNLWRCEVAVYASEFTHDARLWRERNKAPIGMAILIQPVVSFRFEENFLPALSGTAYTSYNGLLTIRAVIGLGTQAVDGSGIVYNCTSDHVLHFQREMWEQEEADTISLTGEIGKTHTHYPEIFGEIARGFEAFNGIFEKLAQLQKQGNFYLEWAIVDGKVFVVQLATYEDRLAGDVSFDSSNYFLLMKGNDILHSGRATCKCIVYVHEWSLEISQVVEHLNETIGDYLLIVPQDALSQLADIHIHGHRLAFRHFSNALAVVEKQRAYTQSQSLMLAQIGKSRADHSNRMGASHFSQLCDRTNILFIGGEFDSTPLFVLPGGMDYRNGIGITIWDVATEVVVDSSKEEGFVYISKLAKKCEYSLYQLQDWSEALRSVANGMGDSEDQTMANHFYAVHYAIASDDNPVGFDPFKLDETAVAEFGWNGGIIESLKAVIANGDQFVSEDVWNGGLKSYLEELLVHLQ